jgi:peptidoglycan/LPS O-acetylase OafA/YrhL
MILLTGLQADFRRSRRRKPRAFGAAALLCLALLALLTVAQVAHTHPAESDADRCPLCIAMQSAAPSAAIAAVVVLVQIQAAPRVFEARAVIRHWHPKLFTRPPPASC